MSFPCWRQYRSTQANGSEVRADHALTDVERGFEESESAEIGAYANLPKCQTPGDGRGTPESRRRPRRPWLPRWATGAAIGAVSYGLLILPITDGGLPLR